MVELQPSKLAMRVRFPSPALLGRLRNCRISFAKLQQQIVSAIYQLIVGNYRPEISNLWSPIVPPSKSSTPRAGLCLGVEQREVENGLGVSVPSPRGTSLG